MTKADESLAFICPKGRAQPKIFAYSDNVNAEGRHNDNSGADGRLGRIAGRGRRRRGRSRDAWRVRSLAVTDGHLRLFAEKVESYLL